MGSRSREASYQAASAEVGSRSREVAFGQVASNQVASDQVAFGVGSRSREVASDQVASKEDNHIQEEVIVESFPIVVLAAHRVLELEAYLVQQQEA